ncbi:MAG: class III extradiol ring-cleavage dioxygenase [Rectinemataceae bacterium]|jgi:aromatic ring-opening dioxygenase catalytic subunit (LigB family)
MDKAKKLPVIYIPHGGGPWHVMKDSFGDGSGYEGLEAYLRGLGAEFKDKIESILVISAHWEEARPTLHFGKSPGMLYDYGGFPDYTYKIVWPAPGDPGLAGRAASLLASAGIVTGREEERGYDHGTFVPMMLSFPEAKLPVAQLSLVKGLDPELHFEVGKALEPLREEGVLIIGSGMSYHNMRGFMSGDPRVMAVSRLFDDWLAETVAIADPEERRKRLVDWKRAPGGLECHPRSEHLVPLFVMAGAAGADHGRRDYSAELMGVQVSSHRFGE